MSSRVLQIATLPCTFLAQCVSRPEGECLVKDSLQRDGYPVCNEASGEGYVGLKITCNGGTTPCILKVLILLLVNGCEIHSYYSNYVLVKSIIFIKSLASADDVCMCM